MSITYRQANDTDLGSATQIVADAINDLRARHGVSPDFAPRAPSFQRHCLAKDPDGLWVAERNGQLVGFGFAWVCEDFWFLAQLFIRPDAQAAGIGQRLFDLTLAPGIRHQASNRALITFAYNRASTGLYIRNGLYPRQPLYAMQAPAERIRSRLEASRYEAEPLPVDLPTWISELDAQVLGFRRDEHHRFLRSNPATRGIRITGSGKSLGYAYINGGHIGPIAIDPTADAGQAVNAVIRATLEDNPPEIDLMVPGAADAVMGAVVNAGFRITEPMVTLSAKPFGAWDRYLPNNPGFM